MKFGGGRKFRATWTKDADGVSHPSKGEAEWWDRLKLRERAGEIRALERRPKFEVRIAHDCQYCRDHGEKIGFIEADAAYDDRDGARHVVDYKGGEGETPLSRFKRRFVLARFKVDIEIVGPAVKQAARHKAKKDAEKQALAQRGKS